MIRIGNLNKKLVRNPSIYRIELLSRFYDMLNSKKTVFVKPDKWEDPLENLIFNAKIIKNGKPFKNPAKEKIFAQCWSYEGDSYALWKIYTTKPDNNGTVKRHFGVRITTNLELLNQLSKINEGKLFYGLVKYKWKYELDKLPKDKKIKKILNVTIPNEKHIETLLIKRKSYSYEKEIRLFFIPDDNSYIDNEDRNLCRLSFEPLKFITSIKFDPGMEYNIFKEHKQKLIEKYGFKKSQITQSTYFKKNNYVINLDE